MDSVNVSGHYSVHPFPTMGHGGTVGWGVTLFRSSLQEFTALHHPVIMIINLVCSSYLQELDFISKLTHTEIL